MDPDEVKKKFKKSGHLKKVQRVLSKDDNYGSAVMFVHELMKELNMFADLPDVEREKKCPFKSHFLRDQGNTYFKQMEYDHALQHYNLSLKYAPKGSTAMKLSLGNRSALFFRLKRYRACELDIQAVYKMNCPSGIKSKLAARLKECQTAKYEEPKTDPKLTAACQEYLRVKQANEKIPCASASVEIVIKDEKKSVVTNKPIELGEVVAVETPFVSHMSREHQNICCHQCHSFAENLTPCDCCCSVLYCSDTCRDSAWKEGHRVECSMMNLCSVYPNLFRLALKALLKARSECTSWDDLMNKVKKANECDDAVKGFASCQDSRILDSKYYESVCTQAPFKNTAMNEHMFRMVVFAATAIHALSIVYLKDITPDKKEEVLKFIGHQLVFHSVAGLAKHISAAISDNYSKEMPDPKLCFPNKAIGYFGFAGLLPHSCIPNVEAYGLNKKIVLIATKSIPAGTELVTCYAMNYLMARKMKREQILQKHFRMRCSCEACDKNWTIDPAPTYDITHEQDNCIIKFLLTRKFEVKSLKAAVENYKELCEALALLSNRPKSQYYLSMYNAFYSCLHCFLYRIAPHYLKSEIMSIETTLKSIEFSQDGVKNRQG